MGLSKKLLIVDALILVLLLIVLIFVYPISYKELSVILDGDHYSVNNKNFQIVDTTITASHTSAALLVKDNENIYYIVNITRSPLFKTYRLEKPHSFEDKMLQHPTDYFNDVTISRKAYQLHMVESQRVPHEIILMYLTIVISLSASLVGYKMNK